MDDPEREPSDREAEPKADPRAEREGRLAKALRENLRRRKALQGPSGGRPGTE